MFFKNSLQDRKQSRKINSNSDKTERRKTMRKGISVLVILFVLLFGYNAFAVPDLMLPFPGGETWNIFDRFLFSR